MDWSRVEKHYDQNTTSGFALSLLEAEKLLLETLAEKKFPGRGTEEKLSIARKFLSAPDSLKQGRRLTDQILKLDIPANITKQATEQILRSYFQATLELSELGAAKIGALRLSYFALRVKEVLKITLLFTLLTVAVVVSLTLLLSQTEAGRKTSSFLINISKFIALRGLPVLLILITLAAVIIGIVIKRHGEKSDV